MGSQPSFRASPLDLSGPGTLVDLEAAEFEGIKLSQSRPERYKEGAQQKKGPGASHGAISGLRMSRRLYGKRALGCRVMLVLLRHLHWAKELVQRRQPRTRIRLADPHVAGSARVAEGFLALYLSSQWRAASPQANGAHFKIRKSSVHRSPLIAI